MAEIEDHGDDCSSTQLIDGDGEFNAEGLDRFMRRVRMAERGLSYAVVSIMGPQSSGKSTLLNQLFGTNFREMDAFRGRSQTTKGIWIARSAGIEPLTVIMDLEGTDGRERGEDDTAFEKQSALFALAISDIVLINMWCHDIGREQAANKPLLKTVFQVMMRLFSPRKTTLLFVIRDKTRTPLEHLEPVLREDIQKIWDSVTKTDCHKDTALSEFFNVEVTALPSFEEKEDQFKEQVGVLKQRFNHSIAPGGLAGDRRGVIPASGFSLSSQEIWKVIRQNKDLDLPAHKVMVATVRCEEIANEKLSHLTSDEGWLDLEEAVQCGPVLGFGKKLCAVLDTCLSEYDKEAIYFDEGVRTTKRQQLESRALNLVFPAFQMMLGHIRSRALERFKDELDSSLKKGTGFSEAYCDCKCSSLVEFNQGCEDMSVTHAEWDTSKVREKLDHDIEAHATSIRSAKLSELVSKYEKQLDETIAEPVESLFDAGGQETWASIRKLYSSETNTVLSWFISSLSGFELEQVTFDKMKADLKDYARTIIEKKAREGAGKVLIHMKDRFSMVFNYDKDSMPRVWTGKEDIRKITKDARTAALKLLSVMAAIRLDEKPDRIENILNSALNDVPIARERSTASSRDPLASSTWEEVTPKNTLITPLQCNSLWRQFKAETEYIVTQAISSQVAHRRSNGWLPPPWAILAIAVLGFNEFMMLLRNPFYLVILFVMYLVSKALYIQLDIAGEFRNGAVSGILSVSSKLLPTIMKLLTKLAAQGAENPQTPQAPPPLSLQSYGAQSWDNNTTLSRSVPDSSSAVSSPKKGPELTSPS